MKLYHAAFAFLSTMALSHVGAQITTTQAPAEVMVSDLLSVNPFISLVEASFTGNPICAGLFSGGNSAVPDDFPDTGVVISTGNPASLHLQTTDRESNLNGAPGDPDLDAIVSGATTDACVLEFKFTCSLDPCPIAFEYVWGSEEYNEFVGSPFNDVFAWFLNGQNIALVPGSDEEVSINTVNGITNTEYFRDNDPSDTNVPFPQMEADGFTTTLTAQGDAVQGVNTMKLVIADRSDQFFDSWALFKTDSFIVVPPSGGGGGDPHFRRWGRDRRDTFHGECDLVALHAQDFHQAGLDIHVRTTMHKDLFSFIESAAVRIGEDVLEIRDGGILYADAVYRDEDLPLIFGKHHENEYTLSAAKLERGKDGKVVRRIYHLELDDASIIVFKFYKGFMTFQVDGTDDLYGSNGMLGSYPSGAMSGRQGQEMKSFEEFGFEWQVSPEDAQLFSESRGPQLPYERCRLPDTSVQTSRRRLLRGNENAHLLREAQSVCARISGPDFSLCVDDVLMTGDVGMAEEW